MSYSIEFKSEFAKRATERIFKHRSSASNYLSEFMDEVRCYKFPDPQTAVHIRSGFKIVCNFDIRSILGESVPSPTPPKTAGKTVSLTELCIELSIDPRKARSKLRKSKLSAMGRWEFSGESLAQARVILRRAT